MFRRRTSLFLSAAGAVLVAAPLLTACGSEAHPGAAAVVGGERITMSQVQAKVEAVREAQRATEEGAQLIANTGRLTRGTLNALVTQRVLERAAEDAGVVVTRRDVQLAREEEERRMGGAEQHRAMMLHQYAVTPDEIDDALRFQLLFQRLGERIGADPRPLLGETSEKMGVSVNPRYGTWDDQRVSLADSEDPWIKNVSNPDPEQPA